MIRLLYLIENPEHRFARGGGKSSSSTASTQNTTQQSIDGVTTARNILIGQTLNVTEEFPDSVKETFDKLIDFAGGSLETVNQTATKALDAVSLDKLQTNNPNQATTKELIPVAIIIALGFVGYMIFGKGK